MRWLKSNLVLISSIITSVGIIIGAFISIDNRYVTRAEFKRFKTDTEIYITEEDLRKVRDKINALDENDKTNKRIIKEYQNQIDDLRDKLNVMQHEQLKLNSIKTIRATPPQHHQHSSSSEDVDISPPSVDGLK